MEFFQLSLRDRRKAKERLTSCNVEDLNYKTPMGNTLLHIVVEEGDAEFFEMLIDRGADGHIENGFNKTPLQVALMCNNTEIVMMYLKRSTDRFRFAELHHRDPINHDNVFLVEEFIKVIVDFEYSGKKKTCLLCAMMHHALKGRRVRCLRTIMREHHNHIPVGVKCRRRQMMKDSLIHNVDVRGYGIELCMIARNHTIFTVSDGCEIECIRILFAHGANPLMPQPADGGNVNTPLESFIRSEPNFEIVKVVIDRAMSATADFLEMWGGRLLHLALLYGRMCVMRYLITLGANATTVYTHNSGVGRAANSYLFGFRYFKTGVLALSMMTPSHSPIVDRILTHVSAFGNMGNDDRRSLLDLLMLRGVNFDDSTRDPFGYVAYMKTFHQRVRLSHIARFHINLITSREFTHLTYDST